MGVMLIDLDEFQQLNEREGSERGDEVLRRTADVLRQSVRMSDSVVRFGSDDFLIVFSDVNADMLTLLSDEIRRRVSRDVTLDPDSPDHQTCSIGIVLVQPSPKDTQTSQSVLFAAEGALTEAQRFGGNRSVLRILDPGKLYDQTSGQSNQSSSLTTGSSQSQVPLRR